MPALPLLLLTCRNASFKFARSHTSSMIRLVLAGRSGSYTTESDSMSSRNACRASPVGADEKSSLNWMFSRLSLSRFMSYLPLLSFGPSVAVPGLAYLLTPHFGMECLTSLVVLAETFEAAREAAQAVKVNLTTAVPTTTFDSPGTTSAHAKGQLAQFKEDPKVGNFARAFGDAEVRIDASYETPPQHHNPTELFATSCVWNGDSLTIYEPSQYVHGLKNGVAQQLDIDADKVRVINSYVGGAFGSKGSMTPRTAIIASIARRLGRPVKLVATRDQGF